MNFLFYDQDHHLNPTLPMKEYVERKSSHPLGATHVREYLGRGKFRDVPIQPKPATGECPHDLAERETACADGMCPISLQQQLAAVDLPHYFKLVKHLEQQLAAERENLNEAVDFNERLSKINTQLREQLAAEREKVEHADKVIGVMQSDWQTEVTELRHQLAVEQERVKHLFNLYLWSDEELKELQAKAK